MPGDLDQFASQFNALEDKARVMEPDQVKLEIKKLIPEYEPYLTVR